jgi:cupin fold WbuC family metalloprotein
MTEAVTSNGALLALVVRGSAMPGATSFVTPQETELQVGFIVYAEGGVIAPHRHIPSPRTIKSTCEVILVRKGRCEVDIYDEKGSRIASVELRTGDLVMMIAGGHGFRMLEDTVLLEVKQGPYQGLGEKERL